MQESQGKQSILIIANDNKTKENLKACLQDEYQLEFSVSCQQALNIINDREFDIVITEISEARTKGLEVVRKFKESGAQVPVIVISNYQSVPLAVEAMKEGAYDYVTTPLYFEELKMVVMHTLEMKRLISEVKDKKIFQEQALQDSLTGVYNRRYFEELIRREIIRATRYPQKFSLLMFDLDDFKRVNDRFGHPAGDKVLTNCAEAMLRKIRNSDYLARFGGEEFAIIAPHTDKIGALCLASRILNFISSLQFQIAPDQKISMTISAGIAEFGENVMSRDDLVKCSDDAMYQAKRLGKNKICMYGEAAEAKKVS